MRKILLIFLLFPFIAKSQDDPCSKIRKVRDEIIDGFTYETPVVDTSNAERPLAFNLCYTKEISKGKTHYYVYVNSTNLIKKKLKEGIGVTLFLKDGKKISFPKAEVGFNGSSYPSQAYNRKSLFEITTRELLLLKQSPVITFNLATEHVIVKYPDLFFTWLNCLISKK